MEDISRAVPWAVTGFATTPAGAFLTTWYFANDTGLIVEDFRTADWSSGFLLSSATLPARLELVSDRLLSSMMPSSFARLLSGRVSVGSIAENEAAVSPFVEGGFCPNGQYAGKYRSLARLTLDNAF